VSHSSSRQQQQHYQGPQSTPALHRLSTRRQSPPDSHTIHSTDSGASAPLSTKPHPLRLNAGPMNPPISCAVCFRSLDPCRSLCRRFRQRSPSFFRLRPHLCLASAMAVHCRCRTGPGPCPPPRLHTLVLRSKTMPPSLALLLHVFAPHLLNMGNHLPCPCIPTARPLCTPPSFRSSLKPSSTHHTQTSSRMGPLTRTLSMDVRPSTRSHT
jgi:hypothetical protein